MKYEAVFGDQGLFFDAHSDCEMAGNGHYKIDCGEVKVWNFTEKRWCNSHTNTITISAMRRVNCGGWQRTSEFVASGSSKVTHWMPLPPAPEQVKGGE